MITVLRFKDFQGPRLAHQIWGGAWPHGKREPIMVEIGCCRPTVMAITPSGVYLIRCLPGLGSMQLDQYK